MIAPPLTTAHYARPRGTRITRAARWGHRALPPLRAAITHGHGARALPGRRDACPWWLPIARGGSPPAPRADAAQKKKGRISNDILPRKKSWQRATLPRAIPAVPSPLEPFTSVFGMGTGVATPPWPPGKKHTEEIDCPFQPETEPDSWLRSERFDTTKPLGRLVRVGCRHHCLCASRLSRS